MISPKAAPKQVRVLQKTLDILETLKKEPNGIGLADVSRTVAMPKATAGAPFEKFELYRKLVAGNPTVELKGATRAGKVFQRERLLQLLVRSR